MCSNVFGDARDAESGQPLFNKTARQKADAILDLAREGYLSDPLDVVVWEKSGVDEHHLQKFKSLRGTNKVEGGPHGDVYRKFGATHASTRLANNSLTDHRTVYNLQAMAKHIYGVDWDYHHDLSLINRTSFLLNYLSDTTDGADSYSDWMNADLYERTTETFGVCAIQMNPYNSNTAATTKLNSNNDWLRRRQGVAYPILPPHTPEARKYFLANIRKFVADASANGKRKINYNDFAQEWNRTADGKGRFYVTPDVLSAYAKTWDKTNNARASQELIAAKLDLVKQTQQLFQDAPAPFPSSILGVASSAHPQKGVLELTADSDIPSSLAVDLAISRPQIIPPESTAPSQPATGGQGQHRAFTDIALHGPNDDPAPHEENLASTSNEQIQVDSNEISHSNIPVNSQNDTESV
ncbi:hypothetical protein B0H16DRAFT_1461980 [Mycena metata]|uniref:Uncharacterized protein n=1 Tax=Mycena metata TaxID=1033252 RepID=A0AAD7N7A9_9AGAR|nr:hypothetical protein B0H16DRAFT_1461980 [Mycena metata]